MAEIEMLRKYRRDLHKIPELGFDLPETFAYIQEVLKGLGDACTLEYPTTSSICAFFAAAGATTTIALRTDMDALPITEKTGVDFASTHPGTMHACGHDAHMAMALTTCWWMAEHRDELAQNVLVVFQPAEELAGGAKPLCDSGIFQKYNVTCIFGFHVWPTLPAKTIYSKPGPILASSTEVDVTFKGKNAHIGKYWEGRDTLQSAARFIGRTYDQIEEEAFDDNVLCRFGCMQSGTVRNVIADHAEIHGSIRAFTMDDRDHVFQILENCANEIAQKCQCNACVSKNNSAPPVTNNEDLFEELKTVIDDMKTLEAPEYIAEDFAWYQHYIPGVFMLLGTGSDTVLHTDNFIFDEDLLTIGVDAYKCIVAHKWGIGFTH